MEVGEIMEEANKILLVVGATDNNTKDGRDHHSLERFLRQKRIWLNL